MIGYLLLAVAVIVAGVLLVRWLHGDSWGLIAVTGLAAAVLFLVLTGIDSGLERLRAQGQPAYGMADLADGWFGATDDAEFALAAWTVYDPKDGPGHLGWGTWYVMSCSGYPASDH